MAGVGRVEHDLLGDVTVAEDAYYGPQTTRAIALPTVSGRTAGQDATRLIYYLAAIKKCAALANQRIGGLDNARGEAIVQAASEVMAGEFATQFPVDTMTGGGGSVLHMNVNEVIASRANELLTGNKAFSVVHPNTHVNMGQSTNDVLPAAMQLATHDMVTQVADSVAKLVEVTGCKAAEFADVVKLGRTCLQDALPVTLGQEFSGYRDMLARQEGRLRALRGDLLVLGLGGTAVGTGVGALPGFVPTVYQLLRDEIGLPVEANPNLFDAMQNADIYLQASAAMKSLACGLSKMSSDLRIMSSGPRGGLAEIVLPPVLPGSSIMPGKVNPALPELMIQVYFQVCGNDLAITLAVERGELELNVWEAVVHKNLAEAAQLLALGTTLFAERCVTGITANRERNRSMATSSLALAAVVSAVHGYEVGTDVAVNAANTGRSVREVAEEKSLFSHEAAAELLDPMSLVDATSMANLLAGQRSPDQDAARRPGLPQADRT